MTMTAMKIVLIAFIGLFALSAGALAVDDRDLKRLKATNGDVRLK